MGNTLRCCQQQAQRPPSELTFFETGEPTMGRLTNSSVGYLSIVDLAMFKIVSGCNVEALQVLIRQGRSLLVTDTNRTSLLHCASRSGSSEMVELLIQEGLQVNLTDVDGWTAIHIAAELQRDDIVLCLMRHGANPYIKNRKNTTPYELMSNTDLKSLATAKIINGEELVEGGQMGQARKLYELCKDREDLSINQELEFPASEMTQRKTQAERRAVWRVWPKPLEIRLQKPENPAPMFIDLLELLIVRNVEWAVHYLVLAEISSPNTMAEFLSTHSKTLSRVLVAFLASPSIQFMYEVACGVFEKLLRRRESLATNIHRLFSPAKLPRQLLQLSFICQTFAVAWSRCCESNLLHLELVQRLLFALLHSAVAGKKKQHHYEKDKETVSMLASKLQLSEEELSALMEFKPQPRQSKKYSLQEACLQGQVGQLVRLSCCKLFLCQHPMILVARDTGYDYWRNSEGKFVFGRELITIKQR